MVLQGFLLKLSNNFSNANIILSLMLHVLQIQEDFGIIFLTQLPILPFDSVKQKNISSL